MSTEPVKTLSGTAFHINNGSWNGIIIDHGDKKFLLSERYPQDAATEITGTTTLHPSLDARTCDIAPYDALHKYGILLPGHRYVHLNENIIIHVDAPTWIDAYTAIPTTGTAPVNPRVPVKNSASDTHVFVDAIDLASSLHIPPYNADNTLIKVDTWGASNNFDPFDIL